jgi:virginiamycin B lyase
VGITAGPDRAIWFTGLGSNEIGRISLNGRIDRFALPTPNGAP